MTYQAQHAVEAPVLSHTVQTREPRLRQCGCLLQFRSKKMWFSFASNVPQGIRERKFYTTYLTRAIAYKSFTCAHISAVLPSGKLQIKNLFFKI